MHAWSVPSLRALTPPSNTQAVTSLGVVVGVSLLGAVCGGCVKVPPFQQQDGGPGDGNGDGPPSDANGDTDPVTVAMDGTDVLVTAPGYTMRFSSAGARFPYQLSPGGNHLMGGSPQCDDEQAMGIALYPAYRANGADWPGMGTPTVETPLTGPYVGQVRLQWSGAFSCTSGSGSLSGHSTFSFFPDGRLTRFDVVTNGSAKVAAECSACSGGNGSTFVLTSYTTLIVDGGAFLSDGNEAMLDTDGEQVTNIGSTACVRQRQQSIAFSWSNTVNRMRVVNVTPVRSIAFVKDLFSGTTLPAEDFVTTTQMGISATENCGALEQRISQFSADDHQLMVNGNSVGAALVDGIYGGDPRDDGYPVDFPVTLTPAQTVAPRIPAGFAVWLYSQPIPANLTLTHSGSPSGTWYRLQRVGPNSVVVWFDVALENGETITISGS
jgi:hypothetical protein